MNAAELHKSDRIPQSEGPLMDYVLSPYEPLSEMTNKWHSMTIFLHFLRFHRMEEKVKPILKVLYRHLGANKIVWGIKYSHGKPCIELYFYNHCKNAPGNPMAINTLVAKLKPHINIASVVDETIPYIMCSLELSPKDLANQTSEGFRMYLAGSQQQQGYDGVSFLVANREYIRENTYCFYYQPSAPNLQKQLHNSRYIAPYLDQAFPDRYTNCYSICFSTKAQSNALYFSRIPTSQLLHFSQHHFPACIAPVLSSYRDKFTHLCWDIGYDISSPFSLKKVGIYGFL